jgi:type III secretory pathway component EscU
MRHQLGEIKKPKKSDIPTVNTDWLARNLTPDLTADDDIDPADFFDPEEFKIGRREFKSTRP